jgi:hypothetical protein
VSGPAPAAPDEAVAMMAVEKAVADKEATMKRIVEEAAVMVVADKEVANKRTTDEATVKEVTVGARRPNDPIGVFGNIGLSSSLLLLLARLHSEYISFWHSSSSSGAATVMGTAAPTAVRATPGPATGGEPQTPEGSLKTCWRS